MSVFVLSLLQRRLNKQRKWVLFQTMTSPCYAQCLALCVCVCMLWSTNNEETAWLTAAREGLATVQSPFVSEVFSKSSHCHFVLDNVSNEDTYVGTDCDCTVCICVGLLLEPQTPTQQAEQTSQSLSQDLVISPNDNHNILQTCASNWPLKYRNEK